MILTDWKPIVLLLFSLSLFNNTFLAYWGHQQNIKFQYLTLNVIHDVKHILIYNKVTNTFEHNMLPNLRVEYVSSSIAFTNKWQMFPLNLRLYIFILYMYCILYFQYIYFYIVCISYMLYIYYNFLHWGLEMS